MRKAVVFSFLSLLLLPATLASDARAFGTVSKDTPGLGQDSEHEKITRAALSFLEARTLDEMAGTARTFGAVGAPDDPVRGLLVEDAAHCDNADHLDVPDGESYRQSLEDAQAHLVACRGWMVRHIARAVDFAGGLAKPQENNSRLPCGAFLGNFTGNAKCNAIEALGLVLHAAEDFYSHTNWVDIPADGPLGPENPPGLGRTGRAPWLDLRRETPVPEGLISGCFVFVPEIAFCNNWTGALPTKHDDLNKDKGTILDGEPGAGRTKRGAVNDNFARAVNAAIADAQDKWAYFEEKVRARYGADSDAILCAMRRDDAAQCAPREEEENMPDALAAAEDEARGNQLCRAKYPGSVTTGFDGADALCTCPAGWKWNRADNACITAAARETEDRNASCQASYAGSSFTGMKDGKAQCNCPAGWAWNLADKACITRAALAAEKTRACSNLPGSVFQRIDPADKRAVCGCPAGMAWNSGQTQCVAEPIIANPEQLDRAIGELITALAGNGRQAGAASASPQSAPRSFATDNSDVPQAAEEWGIYHIDLGPGHGIEVLHGSKQAIRKREKGSFVGFGRDSETIGELADSGAIKMIEVSRGDSYEEIHREYESLYARAQPSQFWGPFIRISETEIHKYNNPQPVGAPRR